MYNYTLNSSRAAGGSSTWFETTLRSNAVFSGSTGTHDPFYDKSLVSRTSNGVTKWAVSNNLSTWTSYTPPFTPTTAPQFGAGGYPYRPTDAFFTSGPTRLLSGERHYFAAKPDGSIIVAVQYFTIPISIKYSTNGGTTWTNADTTPFSALSGPYNFYMVTWANGRFVLQIDVSPGNGVYTSTDGNTWTYQGVPRITASYGSLSRLYSATSYILSTFGSEVNVYTGIGSATTTLSGPNGQGSFMAAVNTTTGTDVLFWTSFDSKFWTYNGVGSAATYVMQRSGATVLALAWDRYASRYVGIFQVGSTRTLEFLSGATWTVISTLGTTVDSSILNLIVHGSGSYAVVGKRTVSVGFNDYGAFYGWDAVTSTWVSSSELIGVGGLSGVEHFLFLGNTNQCIIGDEQGLLSGTVRTTPLHAYRGWRYIAYNTTTNQLEAYVSKDGMATWVSGNGSTIANTIGNTASLPYRRYKFWDLGPTAYLAAPVANVSSNDTGPLVLKTTDGGGTWRKVLDLRNSVTAIYITEPGAYTLPPTVTMTNPTTGNVATFTAVLGNVTSNSVTVTNRGTGYNWGSIHFGGPDDSIHGQSPEASIVIRNGGIDAVKMRRRGLGYSSAPTVTINGQSGASGATGTMGLEPNPGLIRILIDNPGTGYPQGRYDLQITKNPSDPAAGGGAAYAEVGTPNVIFSELCGKAGGDDIMVLAPSGTISGTQALSASTYYVSTDKGESWTAQRLPRTSVTVPGSDATANFSAWSYRIIRGVDYAYVGTYGQAFHFYGSDIYQAAYVQSRSFACAANIVNASTTITPSGFPTTSHAGGNIFYHTTANEPYAGFSSVANNGNSTSNATAFVGIIQTIHSAVGQQSNGAVRNIVCRAPAAGTSFITILATPTNMNIVWNKIEYNHTERSWVAYGANGVVAVSNVADASTWTLYSNPGSLF